MVWGDAYPSNVCQECVTNINVLYNFRKVIINSDKELQERSATLTCKNAEKIRDDSVNVNSDEMMENKDNSFAKEYESKCYSVGVEESATKANSNMKSSVCNVCNETFSSRSKLSHHKREVHNMKSGMCNVCGMLIRADYLKKHVALHFADPAACDECGKTLKNFESLRRHKQIHSGITFTCEICGRTFKTKSDYSRHFRGHTDPEWRKSKCKICGKIVGEMKKHLNSHTGNKPYACKYCTKGFTSSNALKVHIRQHTNEKPYICDLCSMAFRQKVSLAYHIKSVH